MGKSGRRSRHPVEVGFQVLIKSALNAQFGTASRLANYHLATLTDDECFWRPAPVGPNVQLSAEGRWTADWPEDEAYALGPPSIAWLTWHIGFWWSMVLDHSFGEGRLRREDIIWPGNAAAAVAWISGLESRGVEALDVLTEAELQSSQLTRWPFLDRPFADVAAWVNLELTKNAAEIGYARFLYAARQ